MTDRERWVDTLNKGNLDLDIAFKYFVEKGGNPDAEAFRMIFKLLPEAKEAVYNTLNVHFEVIIYEDNNNNIVKFY